MNSFAAIPWKNNLDRIEKYSVNPVQTLNGILISDDYGVDVAVVALNNPKFRANLNLFMAAPEMYEALSELVPLLAVHTYSRDTAIEISKLLARIDGPEAEHEKVH